jgi:flagellar hook protein FlgE
VPIQLPTGGVAPQATEAINMQYNLDSRGGVKASAAAPIDFDDSGTYNDARSQTVYDAKGQPITLTYYFQRSSAATAADPTLPDEWNVYLTANGAIWWGYEAAPDPVFTVTFTDDGRAHRDVAGCDQHRQRHVVDLARHPGRAGVRQGRRPRNNTLPCCCRA